MSDIRGRKLLTLISEHRNEIRQILPIDSEYYFEFRGKFFSLLKHESGELVFFAYPKWMEETADLVTLMQRGIETPNATFVVILEGRGDAQMIGLHEWLRAQDIGIDSLYSDLGIDG